MIVRPVSKFPLDNKKRKKKATGKNAAEAKKLIYCLFFKLCKFIVCILW